MCIFIKKNVHVIMSVCLSTWKATRILKRNEIFIFIPFVNKAIQSIHGNSHLYIFFFANIFYLLGVFYVLYKHLWNQRLKNEIQSSKVDVLNVENEDLFVCTDDPHHRAFFVDCKRNVEKKYAFDISSHHFSLIHP